MTLLVSTGLVIPLAASGNSALIVGFSVEGSMEIDVLIK